MTTFDEAAQVAANTVRRELRDSAAERLKKVAGNQQRRSDCHEAFMAGHEKGFASGWAAAVEWHREAKRAATCPHCGDVGECDRLTCHVLTKRGLDRLAREACAPFSAERAVRA